MVIWISFSPTHKLVIFVGLCISSNKSVQIIKLVSSIALFRKSRVFSSSCFFVKGYLTLQKRAMDTMGETPAAGTVFRRCQQTFMLRAHGCRIFDSLDHIVDWVYLVEIAQVEWSVGYAYLIVAPCLLRQYSLCMRQAFDLL